MGRIKNISVDGFKSIKELNNLELKKLNVIVGANGAGKSNFIQIFKMLDAMSHGHFQEFILKNGGADAFPFCGLKETPEVKIEFEFTSNSPCSRGSNFYRISMSPNNEEQMVLYEECKYDDHGWHSYGSHSLESKLPDKIKNERSYNGQFDGVGSNVYDSISKWTVYHFHDTSSSAPMRRSEIVEDYKKLDGSARNIAPFLLHLRETSPLSYRDIVKTLRLVIPFFEDFKLDIIKMGDAEKVKLTWKQKGTDYPMQPYHLSDGSIRFICLATALLQPIPPTTIIIDEPELGLHPEAIQILAELIKSAAKKTQVIVATQSPLLLDQFSLEDIIVAHRQNGTSTFEHLNEEDYVHWLKDYTIGELWTKNVIEGGTVHE